MVTVWRSPGAQQAVSGLQALCLLVTSVVAEPFYQRRDHLDQTRYLQTHNDNVVKDRNDAEFVLSKYGYLQCRILRKKREAGRRGRHGRGGRGRMQASGPNAAASSASSADAFNPWGADFELAEEAGEGLAVCEEGEVQKAIREYQRTYNLTPTGQLDEQTKTLMSTSRCGNKDGEASPTASSTAPTPLTTPSQPPAPSSNNMNVHIPESSSSSSSSHKHHHGHHKHHRHRQLSDEDLNGSDPARRGAGQRLWKRAVNRIRADDPSKLLRVLKGAAKDRAQQQSRHSRHLLEYIRKLPRADPRLLQPWTQDEHVIVKRSIIQVGGQGQEEEVDPDPMANLLDVSEQRIAEAGAEQQEAVGNGQLMFDKELVKWRLLTTGYSTRIPVTDQRATLDLAFRMWSEVIPLRFMEDEESDIAQVDIQVAFGRGAHQNCEHDFDGNGGEIAHSQHTGNMHFDDEENFKSIRSYTPDGIYLLRVAVHEIGHVLGLAHTNKSQSIMYAIYHGSELTPEFELSRDDRHDVQKIYGVCKGVFSTVFDWVRKRPDNQFIYNTYFFRRNHYWMYENHANRTRYGDPLYIAREWDGVPDNADGYLHTWYFTGSHIVDHAFFFKGEHYYRYDSDNDRVFDGWPRLISQDFGAKEGQTERVPDNLDTVFFDMRDRNIYFFKDDMVYVFDPKEPDDSRGCCLRKRPIVEEFPPASPQDLPLPASLDAVYYSYGDKMQYFIKGENLWRNHVFDPRQRRTVNSVQYVGKWFDRWMDICDVQVH